MSLKATTRSEATAKCECSECTISRQQRTKAKGAPLSATSTRAIITFSLWIVVFAVAYKLATTKLDSKIYDPFEILGLAPTSDEKLIKRHYKKLSLKFHPDKVKVVLNQTLEDVSRHFVDLTKAYKALTDETIRENLRLYGNPDGKQDFKVGIALPPWIIESSNNGWVLGTYAVLFGGALPYLVGRWWFGSRKLTKDGVTSYTAETYFKLLSEDDGIWDIIRILAIGSQHEPLKASTVRFDVSKLQQEVELALGTEQWVSLTKDANEPTRLISVLIVAHLLRLHIGHPNLLASQTELLLRTPSLLASLLQISLSHNWLTTSVHIMHIHACLAQALLPGSDGMLQLPSSSPIGQSESFDSSATNVTKAVDHLGQLHVVDTYFKVIGERIITPSAIVQLIFELCLVPPGSPIPEGENFDDEVMPHRDTRHQNFLTTKKESEETSVDVHLAHTPRWPEERKPGWWVFVGDEKQNRIFVPPIRISDVPIYRPGSDLGKEPRDRLYKITFQAPPTASVLPLQLHFVSDTFTWRDVQKTVLLKIEDVTALTPEEQGAEDDISDPEEDSLAGQMAALRGGSVKRVVADDSDDDEDESTTDGEQRTDSDSDSD